MRFLVGIWLLLQLSTQSVFSQKVVLNLSASGEKPIQTDYRFNSVWVSPNVNPAIGQVYFRPNEKAPVFLQERIDRAILDFYSNKISVQSAKPQEIEVRVMALKVGEDYNPALKVYQGSIELMLRFNLLGRSSPIHLLDFKKEAKYQRSLNAVNQLEELINQYFSESLMFFDNWMKEQASSNPHLAKKVELKIVDGAGESNQDTVFYDPERPLQWTDFRDRPNPSSKYNAVIVNSFSIQGNGELVDGTIVQKIHLKVFMLPQQSWTRDSEEYGINHERRHFDLVRIIANQFKKNLMELSLDPEFFQAQINDLYFEYYRKMTRIQQLYDSQTSNGMNREIQGTWNLWIKAGIEGDWSFLENALAGASN